MTETYYNQRTLNLFFWLTNLATVLLLAVFAWRELQPKWKPYQKQFQRLELAKVGKQLREARDSLRNDADYADARRQLREVEKALSNSHYKTVQQQLARLQSRQARAGRAFQQTRAEFIRVEDEYFHTRGTAQKKWQARRQALQREMLSLQPKLDGYAQQVSDLQSKGDALLASKRQARQSVDKFEGSVRLLEKRLSGVRQRPFMIQQIVNDELGIVDRCASCHLGIDKPDFDDDKVPRVFRYHPRFEELIKPHPLEKYGCTPCHRGQGSALTRNAAHGHVPHFEKPFLIAEYRDAACGQCHAEERDLKAASHLSSGKRLFDLAGCFGCHETKGYESAPKFGPSLSHVASKLTPEWAVAWVQDPRSFSPNTRMPHFYFSEAQARAVVAYLWQHSTPTKGVATFEASGSAASGKRLVESIGCFACHTLRGKGAFHPLSGNRPYAPDLSNVGGKVSAGWLYAWLKNPRQYFPTARMPNLRLADQEAKDIATYLMTLRRKTVNGIKAPLTSSWWKEPRLVREGERLIGEYGCFGCHEIPGMEGRSKVGVDLSSEGSKDIHQLDFGGKTFDLPHTLPDWLLAKLLQPRQFREGLRMPDFHFSRDEAKMLVTALLSFTEDRVPTSYTRALSETERWMEEGRRLTKRRNCTGCHKLEGKEGDIVALIEMEGMSPPPLEGEGQKVQIEWLARFLKHPTSLRPWLNVRMPTFGFTDQEVTVLARYFTALDKRDAFFTFAGERVIPASQVAIGKHLFTELQCASCHPQPGAKPTGEVSLSDLAPDLSMARRRLRYQWLLEWLRDPQVLQPDTKMPTFFPEGQTSAPDILGGSVPKQIKALADYTYSIGK
ncbi:MAG: c-type cytochrome [Armatimonadetes bacterium]|nr:c-type cytochrome [Armatimonadota bacterium]